MYTHANINTQTPILPPAQCNFVCVCAYLSVYIYIYIYTYLWTSIIYINWRGIIILSTLPPCAKRIRPNPSDLHVICNVPVFEWGYIRLHYLRTQPDESLHYVITPSQIFVYNTSQIRSVLTFDPTRFELFGIIPLVSTIYMGVEMNQEARGGVGHSLIPPRAHSKQ